MLSAHTSSELLLFNLYAGNDSRGIKRRYLVYFKIAIFFSRVIDTIPVLCTGMCINVLSTVWCFCDVDGVFMVLHVP